MTSNSRPFDGFDNDTDDSGGGGGVPTILPPDIDGTGNIITTGNITANGDGVNTGRITSQTIESQSGKVINNLVISNGDVNLTNGGVNAPTGEITAFEYKLLGNNIIKTTVNPVQNTEYCQSKGCAFLPSTNLFTATNTFQQDIVMSGTGKTFANSQGKIVSGEGDIETIKCGSVDCLSGGFNSVKAKEVNFRVGTESGGFVLRQESATDPLGNFLQIKGGTSGQTVTIIDNLHSGNIPSIELSPQDVASGGKITANQYNIGFGTSGFLLNQPRSGVDVDNLRIMSGINNGKIKYQDYGAVKDLLTIEKDAVSGDGLLKVSSISFGTTGLRNTIYNEQTGANNLNLNLKHASDSSEVVFQDHLNANIMEVRKTKIKLGNTIPIEFGAYSWKPTQYYKDITGFSFNNNGLGLTNLIFTTNDTDWVNKNTGASNQSLNLGVFENRGAYKLTFRQTNASVLGQINDMRIMSDIVLTRANDGAPQVVLPSATAYAFEAYDGLAPIITMAPGFLVYNVYLTFPNVSNNETSNVRITLTQMPYFA